MRLNKSTNHAVRILIECGHTPDDLIKVADLSERLDITRQNTFKIVHILSRAGFIEAVRGPHGGVKLAKAAKDIRIGEVVHQIEAGFQHDVGGKAKSGNGFDLLIDDAFKAFLDVLDGQTLANMTKAQSKASRARPSKKKSKQKATNPRKKAAAKRTWSVRTNI